MGRKRMDELIVFICTIFAILSFVLWAAMAHAAQARFSWQPNTETDLAGYKIYCKAGGTTEYPTQGTDIGKPDTDADGLVKSNYIDVPDGAASCVATAYDSAGHESEHSVPAVFDLRPNPPQDFKTISITVNVNFN